MTRFAPARAEQTTVEAVIFDCDGVLVDSEAIYIAAELEYLAGAGLHFERTAYVEAFLGLSPAEWRQRLSDEMVARTGRPPP
ncbi:MAG TPA: hypothetical protein VK891_00440, partial [Euzebyales bacterium]|nr:hypothetical protein [Euzebyales bacterium]